MWLRQHAVTSARARVARTFVWTLAESNTVVGYYALSAHAIAREDAPTRIGRGVPNPVPAALIGKLALDLSLQGQGLGDILLADALERILLASKEGPAVRAILVDASTSRGRRLYERFGFVAIPATDNRMIVRAETIAAALQARAIN